MPRKAPLDDIDSLSAAARYDLTLHMRGLGVATIEDYRAWCLSHGFGAQLQKPAHKRRAELALAQSQGVAAALKRSNRARHNPAALIDELLAGQPTVGDLPAELDIVRQLVPSLGPHEDARQHFRTLVLHCMGTSKLFDARPVVEAYPRNAHNTMLGGLASLATHHRAWLRPVESWRPQTKNVRRQFGALARHLLAEYPVPEFMDSVWFKRSRTQNWFIHVGRGHNIRTAKRLFVQLTRRMAHELMQAPSHYAIEHAFRWAQVHALGGNARVADGVRTTALASTFRNDDFWSTVVRFFVMNPMLDTAQYGPIVDYIRHQKYVTADVFVGPGVVETQPPPQPGFSMRGRSADVLMRQVAVWHRRLGREMRYGEDNWRPCGIKPYELWEGTEGKESRRKWIVDELLSASALVTEGRIMRHCVASYAPSCARGRSSIWSMRCQAHEGTLHVLTIGVSPSDKRVVEARGKFNEAPSAKAMDILRRWAEREDLTLPIYLG